MAGKRTTNYGLDGYGENEGEVRRKVSVFGPQVTAPGAKQRIW